MNDSTRVIRGPRHVWLLDVLTATAIIATVALAVLAAACRSGCAAHISPSMGRWRGC